MNKNKPLNKQIVEYVEKNIFPVYDTFDKGHDSNHAKAVIERSLQYWKVLADENIDINMVYVVAAYHDIGNVVARKNHPYHSKQYLLADQNLTQWFSPEQMLVMAEACEDHSTSSQNPPRSIYGKIVSDADKDNDVSIGLFRAWEYAVGHLAHLSTKEKMEDIHRELVVRFGKDGKVVFYIPSQDNQHFVAEMQKFAQDKTYFMEQFVALGQEKNWF